MNCPECGAPVAPGKTCQDNFHALLFLEAEVPGAAGDVAHFFAVATYNLQHPDRMRLTGEALGALAESVREMLEGTIDIAKLRARTNASVNGTQRVTRRGDDPIVSRGGVAWTMRVTDVIAAGPDSYRTSVVAWARATIDA